MRLVYKINKDYLIGSLIVFGAFLMALFFIIPVVLEEELQEELSKQELLVANMLESGSPVKSLYPIIDISRCRRLETNVFKDTSLWDPIEEEQEKFRELHTYRSIHGTNYHIIVRASAVNKLDFASFLFLIIAAFFLITLSIMFYINRRINRQVWLPFYQNLQTLKQYSLSDDSKIDLEESNILEFEELNQSVQKLTDKISMDYKSLKLFTENAAHELQNPLTIIGSKLEVLINDSEISESQIKILNSIQGSVSRLNNLNKGLLLLTKLDNQQFADIQTIDMKGLINKVLDNYHELIDMDHLELKRHFSSDIICKMDKNQAEILINNLISNAIKHNLKHGKIKLVTKNNVLRISNSGDVKIKESHQIFDRFFKADPAAKSIGLGLSIVKKICEMNSIQIAYDYIDGMHRFTLSF